MMYINELRIQMNRQWMYNADRRSMEFIDGMHKFIEAAKKHKYDGFVRCPCPSIRMRKITHHQEPYTVTYSIVVSCPTTMFGPSMKKEKLCWIIIKKKRTGFLTSRSITVPSLKILQWMRLKKIQKDML